ncbi:hypothetical protein AAFC00_005006 [Neodothiora populina]|uniref:6-phosphogluconate dehydrogenase, decarboxylating n=1 Tax=Neodothiora populina TaxID=2781224 RepID=A0ABR3P5C3_9PEZI
MVHLTSNDFSNGNGHLPQTIEKIGVIGTGVMGSMFALLLASNGITVSIHDRSEQSMQNTAAKAKESGLSDKIIVCKDYDTLCSSLGSPKVFIFSLPHGGPGNGVVQTLAPHLQAGDIVVDASNEDYRVTQKRQSMLEPNGVHYVGMGISGGFNGARYGPAMMPGGSTASVSLLLPLLQKIAARDPQGRPCVAHIGQGGSGHYVKMIHNGIEHGIMSALAEAYELMTCVGMDGDAIGSMFDSWCAEGPLKNNFLVEISGPICRTKNSKGGFLLSDIRDAVVQDANESEGTGVWANEEAITAHVPAPSLAAAHNFRLASSDMSLRATIKPYIGVLETEQMYPREKQKAAFLDKLHDAVYASVLACFAQGLDLMARADEREGWNIDFASVINVWRAGCIIRSDYITDILERHYSASTKKVHPLCGEDVSRDLRRCMPALKSVVIAGLEVNAHLPCLGASLEYLKYMSCETLPTNFMEAQLDCFGAHGYDLKTEPVRRFAKGPHHSDWSVSA